VVLLDAYAVLAVLLGEPAGAELRPHLAGGDATIHPLNLAEVIDRLTRLAGANPDDVEADVALLGISVADTNGDDLVDAGRLRARHYRRGTCDVSLADCVAAVHAVRRRLPLATSDRPLAEVVRREGGRVVALPDSRGRRP